MDDFGVYLCKGGNGKGKDAEAVIKLSGKRTKRQPLGAIYIPRLRHRSEINSVVVVLYCYTQHLRIPTKIPVTGESLERTEL